MSNEIKGTVATVGNISGTLSVASGFDGESAYEVAVKNGFEGTEAEWLESLHGESGVYVGTGDMPEDCNVQIDPNGEVFVVDQNYSPTSTNPISGKGVEEAISTLQTNNGTVVSQNADFAEVAEWWDGNPNNEDRTGYFVCANVPVDGIVMKKATSLDDVKGVSILAPAFAGNYSKDKVDENGNLLPKYSYVAIIGFVPVIDNGTCTVGGRCMPDDNGCAIPSSNSMGYQVVNRIDDNRVLIIIEPNGDMVQRIKTRINKMQEEIDDATKVYLGSGEMPADYNIQVDPNGDEYFEVEQTLKPESTNPISSKAVAEAVSGKADKFTTLIDTTLTEEQGGASEVWIEIPNPKILKTISQMRISVTIAAQEAITAQNTQIAIKNYGGGAYNSFLCWTNCGACNAGENLYFKGVYDIFPMKENLRELIGFYGSPNKYIDANGVGNAVKTLSVMSFGFWESHPPYLHIRLASGGIIGAGSKIVMEVG